MIVGLLCRANNVEIQLHYPISSIGQIVKDSDLECLAPDDQDFEVSKNLKYVGMLSSMKSDTLDFAKWEKDVRATLKMGNLQVVEYLDLNKEIGHNNSYEFFAKKLFFLSKYKIGVVIIVQELFYDKNGKLKSNYIKSWKKLNRILRPFKSLIKGFYLFDEPFWSVESNKKSGNKDFVSEAEMSQNLTTVGNLLHQSLPAIPLVYVEAYPMITDKLKIPDVFDWIGMDCYTGFDNCEGRSIPAYYQILGALQPGKKWVVLPPAIIFKKSEEIKTEDRIKLKNIYTQFINWVAKEPNIITSLSFMYRFDQTNETFTGAKKICEVADAHRLYWRKYYRSILGHK